MLECSSSDCSPSSGNELRCTYIANSRKILNQAQHQTTDDGMAHGKKAPAATPQTPCRSRCVQLLTAAASSGRAAVRVIERSDMFTSFRIISRVNYVDWLGARPACCVVVGCVVLPGTIKWKSFRSKTARRGAGRSETTNEWVWIWFEWIRGRDRQASKDNHKVIERKPMLRIWRAYKCLK